MAKKKMMGIFASPKNILIKIPKHEWNNIFSVWITRHDGSREKLFKEVEAEAGYEARFKQNVSVGNIIAAGHEVAGIMKGDIAVIDYLVTGQDDSLIGYQDGHRIVSIRAKTTYHDSDSTPMINGRKTWVRGDYDFLSPFLGVVRMGKVIAREPYVFLKYEEPERLAVSESGMLNMREDYVCIREIISAHPSTGFKDGDKVYVKASDLFERTINNAHMSVVFDSDIQGVL